MSVPSNGAGTDCTRNQAKTFDYAIDEPQWAFLILCERKEFKVGADWGYLRIRDVSKPEALADDEPNLLVVVEDADKEPEHVTS